MVYATLKAAVVHYTRCLAKELIDDGVRDQRGQPRPDQDRPLPGDARVDPVAMAGGAESLNRYAEPAEIAEAVAFLAGPRAPLRQRPGASASTAASRSSRAERSYAPAPR